MLCWTKLEAEIRSFLERKEKVILRSAEIVCIPEEENETDHQIHE